MVAHHKRESIKKWEEDNGTWEHTQDERDHIPMLNSSYLAHVEHSTNQTHHKEEMEH